MPAAIKCNLRARRALTPVLGLCGSGCSGGARRRCPRWLLPPVLLLFLAAGPAYAEQNRNAAEPHIAEPDGTGARQAPPRIDPVSAFGGYDEDAAQEAADTLMHTSLDGASRRVVLGVLSTRPASDPVLIQAMRALSGTLDPVVVGAIIVVINDPEATALTVETGLGSLVRLTGRTDLENATAWRAWWTEYGSGLSTPELAELAGGWQTDRARRLAVAGGELRIQLAQVYRRLYVLSTPEQRTPLLLELLDAESAELRRLGFDLAERESISARALPVDVIDRALTALGDRSAMVRASATTLLYTVNPPEASPRVAELLASERDPDTAAGMLRIFARRPYEPSLPLILSRMMPADEPPVVVDSAVDAALRYHERFGIDSQAGPETVSHDGANLSARVHTIEVLTELAPDRITANGVTLLAALGGPEPIRELMFSQRLPVAQAAAASLENDDGSLDLKVRAAQRNPGLFEFAARAVMRHRPTAEGFTLVADLPATSAGIKSDRLLAFASALPVDHLLRVALAEAELSQRARYIERALTPGFFEQLSAEVALGEPFDGPRSRLVKLLIETRLNLKNPAGVLTLAERMPDELRGLAWARRQRVAALVWLNRLDDAREAGATLGPSAQAGAWLIGLGGASTLPHARSIVEAIRAEHAASFDEAQLRRFSELSQLVEGTAPTAPNTPVDRQSLDNQPDNQNEQDA